MSLYRQCFITLSGLAAGIILAGCTASAREIPEFTPEQTALFSSTDKALETAYVWAKKTALSYAHDSDDPVGAWYEAALPNREAFCMRDVSHQSVGAQILGLSKHNKNMFTHFVENISENRDYCSFWEINRYNLPAPADYASDTEFWYNLNANFDVLQACLKLYEWTGDRDYLSGDKFSRFYSLSLNEYIDRWQLAPENIMDREPIMNASENFNPSYSFHTCRGLPSYVENFKGLSVGIDLIATLYAGYNAHARMAAILGNEEAATASASKASAYRDILEKNWWDSENNRYHTFWTKEKKFFRGEGVPFVLWFDASTDNQRITASVKDILAQKWNVENMSAFPALFYKLGYNDDAYRYLTILPSTERASYPEVSYGVVEGVVCGAMGLKPSASGKSVESLSRVPGKETKIQNVPMLGGYVSLRHQGTKLSEMENNTPQELTWNVSFLGKCRSVKAGGKEYPVKVSKDNAGNSISTASIPLAPQSKLIAEAN